MSQQSLTRCTPSPNSESTESHVWSEEHQVYYYSSFDLFASDQPHLEFYQFSIFLQKVTKELGVDWENEAQMLFPQLYSGSEVFMNLMQLWLRQHPPANSIRQHSHKLATFNPNFIAQFLKKMQDQAIQRNSRVKVNPPSPSLKAVCLGFFMTANQIWEEMFQAEPKKASLFSANGFFKQVTHSIEKTFHPLMVVTQKISSVFGRKKRKFNEQIKLQECDQLKFEDCYHQFRRTLDIQKHLEKKIGEITLLDESPSSQSKIFEKKQFKQAQAPIESSIMGNLYSYVNDFLHRNPSWQVASNFVTQILELGQTKFEEGKKVKVMRPAQDFYRKLVMVWLMAHSDSNQPIISFQNYLTRVKSILTTESWQEKYIIPTKYFYERMRLDWEEIKKEGIKGGMGEKEVLDAFIRRIRNRMKRDWDRKIQLRE